MPKTVATMMFTLQKLVFGLFFVKEVAILHFIIAFAISFNIINFK